MPQRKPQLVRFGGRYVDMRLYSTSDKPVDPVKEAEKEAKKAEKEAKKEEKKEQKEAEEQQDRIRQLLEERLSFQPKTKGKFSTRRA
jgi:hypothetical protein